MITWTSIQEPLMIMKISKIYFTIFSGSKNKNSGSKKERKKKQRGRKEELNNRRKGKRKSKNMKRDNKRKKGNKRH